MASKARMMFPSRVWMRSGPMQKVYNCARCRFYAAEASSSNPPSSPLLVQLRTDLKTAMRAKDTARLSVIRALLAEVTNAAKTPRAIETDVQVLSLIRKRIAAAKEAGESFKAAGREDLSQQEDAQATVLQEYASNVDTVSEAEMKEAVEQAITSLDAKSRNLGMVMKVLTGSGGKLAGRPVVGKDLAAIISRAL